jgi:4-amino-4-deoxychorismate lyase
MTQTAWPSWINGEPGRLLPLTERGLQFGDGLFETMRVAQGRLPLWDYHRARLFSGAKRLGIVFDGEELQQQLQQFLSKLPASDAVVKITLTRGRSERGYAVSDGVPPSIILQSFPYAAKPRLWYEQGARLSVCETRLGLNPLLAGIKHLNRLEQVLARRELDGSAIADGLMLDIEDNLVDGCASNVFWVTDGVVHTPDLSRCGVAGVMRQCILDKLAEWGVPTRIAHFKLQSLSDAQEVFVCSSLIGCLPVGAIDDRQWSVGELSRRIMREVEERYAA